MQRIAMIIAILALAVSCAPSRKSPDLMPALAPPPSQPMPQDENPGSLFDATQSSVLFEDNRARRVGDLVMVQVVENSSGKHKADTDAAKESSINLGVENYFGRQNFNTLPLGLPQFGMKAATGTTPLVKAGVSTELAATGETKRESDLTASVGARVVRVLPNGVLQIEGAREMRINDETQILVVRGLVRQQDIGPDNTVSSNYLANAKIDYFGEGVLADKQKPGWLTRILDNIWPF